MDIEAIRKIPDHEMAARIAAQVGAVPLASLTKPLVPPVAALRALQQTIELFGDRLGPQETVWLMARMFDVAESLRAGFDRMRAREISRAASHHIDPPNIPRIRLVIDNSDGDTHGQ